MYHVYFEVLNKLSFVAVLIVLLMRAQETTTTDWSSDESAMFADNTTVSCVTGSTAIDALRLALGSTLGAFIALAVVVAFVLLAKCQHRRRLRRMRRRRSRRRRYSDKSQPLTDSDNLSFFDYYDYNDDDDYGSVFNDNGQNADVAPAAATDFSPRSSPMRFTTPSRCDKTRLFVDEFTTYTDDGDRSGRKWISGDTSAQFYDVPRNTESPAESDQSRSQMDSTRCGRIAAGNHTQSAFDSSVGCPAVFVSGIADDHGEEDRPAVGQGVRAAPTSVSTSAPRCFNYDVVGETTLGPMSEVLRLMTQAPPRAAGIFDATATDCRDTAWLLSASDVERSTEGLRPNHYSTLW